jgi:hypothetical protein
MKNSKAVAFSSDWQIPDFFSCELNVNQETDGLEEDKEYRFYSMPEEGHAFHKEGKELNCNGLRS